MYSLEIPVHYINEVIHSIELIAIINDIVVLENLLIIIIICVSDMSYVIIT